MHGKDVNEAPQKAAWWPGSDDGCSRSNFFSIRGKGWLSAVLCATLLLQ